MAGTLTFKHQDGDLVFRVKKALFMTDADDRLTVSSGPTADALFSRLGEESVDLLVERHRGPPRDV